MRRTSFVLPTPHHTSSSTSSFSLGDSHTSQSLRKGSTSQGNGNGGGGGPPVLGATRMSLSGGARRSTVGVGFGDSMLAALNASASVMAFAELQRIDTSVGQGAGGKESMFAPMLLEEKRPTRFFVLDQIQFDIDQLIRDSVAKNTIKLNKEFENILGSTEFDNFLKHAVVYTRAFIREQLIRTQDRAAKSWMDVPPAFLRQVNEIAKQEFFGTDRISMAQARDETESSLHDFSFAYCHMLLFNSRHSRAPAKERYHFEGMYTIVMDVVKVILQAHSLSQVIDYELKRLFRSHLFSTETKQDVVDPIQAQFIASLYQQQLRAQHHRQMDHAGGGSGGGGSSGTAGMMAWVAANSGGGGSGGGGMGQTDRSGWMGSSMAGTMGGFASAVSGTHQHQPRGRSAGSSSSAGTTSGGRGGKPVRMGGVGQWGPPIGHGHGHARLHSQATRHPADQLHPPMLQPRPGSSASNRSAGSSHPHGHGSPGAMNRSGGGASRPTSGLAGNARLPTPAFTYRMDDEMGGPQLAATASSRPGSATFRRKKISINAVRMLRSPLANETLPPVQRFLFVQSRPEAISSVVG